MHNVIYNPKPFKVGYNIPVLPMRKLRFRKLSNLPKVRQKLRIYYILLHVHAFPKERDCCHEEDIVDCFYT